MKDKFIITDRCVAVVQTENGKYEVFPKSAVLTSGEISLSSLSDAGIESRVGEHARRPNFRVHGNGDFTSESHFHRTVSKDLAAAVFGGASSIHAIYEQLRSNEKPYVVNPVENA